MTNVFVYGSLKKGFHNHSLLENSKMVGKSVIKGFRMVSLGGYPGLVPAATGRCHHVKGEIYEVDQPTMVRLDRLEGHPHFYHRETVTTESGVPCWVYVLPEAQYGNNPSVDSGEWKLNERAA